MHELFHNVLTTIRSSFEITDQFLQVNDKLKGESTYL